MKRHLALGVALAVLGCGEEGVMAPGDDVGEPFTVRDGAGTLSGRLRTLTVPADPGLPGDSIVLSFVVFPSANDAGAPPLILVSGGPGNPSIDEIRGDRFSDLAALSQGRDVVVFDQRGTGRSDPSTSCGRRFDVPLDLLGASSLAGAFTAQFRDCVADTGAEVDHYTTPKSVSDIEAIRVAIGADRVALDGFSYGTHLTLAYVRAFPERVDRVVLRGIEGPDHTWKLPGAVDAQLARIAQVVLDDPATSAVIPDLVHTVDSLTSALDSIPIEVDLSGQPVHLDGDLIRIVIANLIGDRDDISSLVAALELAIAGDLSGFALGALALKTLDMPRVMTVAMDCASGASTGRRDQIAVEAPTAVLRDAINFPYPRLCDAVEVADVGNSFRDPVVSDVPALFVSGTLDGRTPVANAIEVAAGFSRSRSVVIDGAGHAALDSEVSGLNDVIIRFLDGEAVGSVELSLPPLQFVRP
ncbi:MAG: alpha/beta fold hydrolase [Gemmatimonadota bacterium]